MLTFVESDTFCFAVTFQEPILLGSRHFNEELQDLQDYRRTPQEAAQE